MRRCGLTKLELLVVLAVVTVLGSLLSPALLSVREAARGRTCRNNLERIGVALRAYHDSFHSLPPAATWRTDRTQSLALHASQRVDLFTGMNWLQQLLPYLDEASLAEQFNRDVLVADAENEKARTTRIAKLSCPSDHFNSENNHYVFQFDPKSSARIPFARGNYAINGGSNNHRLFPGSAAKPVGDGPTLLTNRETREFGYSGNGVAGINKSFSFDDFTNGLATTVAVDEIRAGVHAIDPRGVWALGQIASSITWSHGINGDAGHPNDQWERSDDLLFGGRLHEVVGKEFLMRQRMPCVSYVHVNDQATARSLHASGVHVLFADGHTRFVSDGIDPGLWHVMHSRQTPKATLENRFDELLDAENHPERPATQPSAPTNLDQLPPRIVNAVGMEFILIPTGEFTMGLADEGNNDELPLECPPHQVHVTRPLYVGIYEVTQGQFEKVMGQNPSWHVGERAAANANTHDFPVEQVTWNQAVDFCQALSDLSEERLARRGYRLPTEAEWEYACRSGQSKPYVWQQRRDRNDGSGDNAGRQPSLPIAAVGSYPSNAFGLHDMRGNVWEWTADWYDRDYYLRSPASDPQGPAQGFLKVVRGGDWTFAGETCRINYPMTPPWKSSRFIGFRVVCELTAAPQRKSPGGK